MENKPWVRFANFARVMQDSKATMLACSFKAITDTAATSAAGGSGIVAREFSEIYDARVRRECSSEF